VTEPPRERLGIFGGTFDPIHVGHLVAAVEARSALRLDHVVLVVAGDPWQKRGEVVASAPDRLATVEAAIAGIEGLSASDLEVRRDGVTYTIDTVRELAEPARDLFLIVGADVAGRLETWHQAEALRELVTLVIVDREGTEPSRPTKGWRTEHVGIPRLDVSSSAIRNRLATNRPVDGLVPAAAVRIIRERRLYTPGR
jgi:nicotinate-nucleotide adenylyltransferase